MSLPDISIRRPVFAWMLMFALMIFGLISFQGLGVSKLPDVDFPNISIRLTYEGAAPEVMEADVVDAVEDAMTTIQGIREITSNVRQGSATVSLELEIDRDIDVTVQEVQTKLAQAQRQLPDDMDPPIVSKVNPEDQPIMWLTATTTSPDIPITYLMEYVQDHLEDRFTTVSGVGEVFLGGFVERNLRIWVDREKLNQYELTVQDLINAVQAEHAEVPAGRIETGTQEFNVRAMGEAVSVEDFENIVIARRGGAPIYTPIYLKDVARIEDGTADVRRISRRNGEQGVGLGIRKQRGVNTVEVGHRVLQRLEEVKKDLPPGIDLNLTVNNIEFIENSIHELTFTLILSAIVTALVCWFFLGSFTATINVLMAIPTSILGAFIFLKIFGFTLNTFTMLALSLAIGIVVDDAIMVLENIVRHREKGEDKVTAARNGANQVSFAAMATTAAIIAIFLPVAFMTGVMGKYFFEFGITISCAVAISLLEALTLTPMRCSQFLHMGGRTTRFGHAIEAGFDKLRDKYRNRMDWILKHRLIVLSAGLIFFAASLILFKVLPKEMMPAQDQSMFFARIQTPVGSSLEVTDKKFKEIEAFIRTRPEVDRYYAVVGGFGGGAVNRGQIFIILKPKGERPITPPYNRRPSQKDVMALFREELGKIKDVTVKIQDPSLRALSSRRGNPIEFTVQGPDWDKLVEFTTTIQKRMEESGLMTDVDTNYEEGVSEFRVIPNREKAAERGVTIESIGQTLNALLAGERIAQYTKGGRRYDVRVRLEAAQRTKAEDINNLYLWNNYGERVRLADVVDIVEKPSQLTITRVNRARGINLSANVADGKSQTDAIEAVERIVKEVLPENYYARFGGSTQIFQESFASFSFVFWLGILVAYMVLASQFNSFIDPFTILLALPFSVSGALIALFITGQSLNMYSIIGLILLAGIVKKNSIMLVDFTNQMRAQGLAPNDALREACPIRLRPILMTSFATIAAAIPAAIAIGPGAEVLRPMATTVIGGTIVSTFFTLLVVPCVYSYFVKLERKKKEGL